VDVRFVTVGGAAATGCAVILVEDGGQNSIVVAPGANALLSPADVDAAAEDIRSAAAVVVQLEVPVETVRHAVALGRRFGVYTILDPAPALPGGLPPDLYAVDVLTPNQGEGAAILNVAARDAMNPEAMAAALHGRGAKAVVLKLGDAGALVTDGEGVAWRVAAFPVDIVDTTAAGDAFTGALAVARAEGMPLSQAVRFANAAGALCCEKLGAQPSLPTRAAVDALLSGSDVP
jgi:ribokinase